MRCQVLWVVNNYFAPSAPKCINRKAFLPVTNPEMPCQDYREGQPQKTLAYAQALQYWAEKANLPCPGERHLLVRCVQELRWAMRPFTTFIDHAVLEGAIPNLGSPEEEAAQPQITLKEETPTRPPTPAAALPNEPAAGHEHPGWMEIHPAASVGSIPVNLGNLRWHCQSEGSSWRKTQCHQREEQWGGGPGDSSSTSSQGSPVPACWMEEDPMRRTYQ